ncbi:hypothetical protein R3P38DRAFT_170424 [Favolaschia claudopus]|uniref:Uncharacterized protein n=1 Tax=Favolaschia claudopus TaxID=2862362 RepID=A0AAW0D1I3_9AGAR
MEWESLKLRAGHTVDFAAIFLPWSHLPITEGRRAHCSARRKSDCFQNPLEIPLQLLSSSAASTSTLAPFAALVRSRRSKNAYCVMSCSRLFSDSLELKRAYNGCDVPKGLILRLVSSVDFMLRSQDAEQLQESPLKLSKPTIKVVGEGNKPIRIKRWGALEFLSRNQCNFLCRSSTVNVSFARILTRFRGPRVPVYRRIETSSLCNGRKRIFSSQFSDNNRLVSALAYAYGCCWILGPRAAASLVPFVSTLLGSIAIRFSWQLLGF